MTDHSPTAGRARRTVALAIALAVLPCGCERGGVTVAAQSDVQANCQRDGRLRGALYGGIAAELDWHGRGLLCEGMRRPGSEGARLRLSGPPDTAANGHRLTFIIALPTLDEGAVANELPASVTLIEEGAGRFFTTRDTGNCWIDLREHAPVAGSLYRAAGVLYCVGPLAQVNGGSSVSLGDVEFTGFVDWKPVE